jgi:hypothetical protein
MNPGHELGGADKDAAKVNEYQFHQSDTHAASLAPKNNPEELFSLYTQVQTGQIGR